MHFPRLNYPVRFSMNTCTYAVCDQMQDQFFFYWKFTKEWTLNCCLQSCTFEAIYKKVEVVGLGKSDFRWSQVSLPWIQNLSPAIFIDLSQKMNVWKCTNGYEASGSRGFSFLVFRVWFGFVFLVFVSCFVVLKWSWLFNTDTRLVPWKKNMLFFLLFKKCLIS